VDILLIWFGAMDFFFFLMDRIGAMDTSVTQSFIEIRYPIIT
jgi:hypothetical protein